MLWHAGLSPEHSRGNWTLLWVSCGEQATSGCLLFTYSQPSMISHCTPLQAPSGVAPGQEDAQNSIWTEPEIAGNSKGQAHSELGDRSADHVG